MKSNFQPADQQLANMDYASWLVDLKQRVRMAQLRASVRVNTELIQLYWDIGHQILEQQEHKVWGAKMKGFSVSNLKFMRMFALQCSREQIGQQPVNQLPWGHIIVLMTRVDNSDERLIYAKMTVENGWSRSVLIHQIEMQTAQRVGKALTNFERTIPESDSELAIQTLKDPYKLQFLEIESKIKENEMRARLVDRVATFLIELVLPMQGKQCPSQWPVMTLKWTYCFIMYDCIDMLSLNSRPVSLSRKTQANSVSI